MSWFYGCSYSGSVPECSSTGFPDAAGSCLKQKPQCTRLTQHQMADVRSKLERLQLNSEIFPSGGGGDQTQSWQDSEHWTQGLNTPVVWFIYSGTSKEKHCCGSVLVRFLFTLTLSNTDWLNSSASWTHHRAPQQLMQHRHLLGGNLCSWWHKELAGNNLLLALLTILDCKWSACYKYWLTGRDGRKRRLLVRQWFRAYCCGNAVTHVLMDCNEVTQE